MATNKPRFSVTFTDSSFEKILKFQKANNISTQSKAVARLVELAICELEAETSEKNPPDTAESKLSLSEKDHIKKYRSLDPYGKEAVDSILDIEYRRCVKQARPKIDIAAEVASYKAELELQEKVEEKSLAFDGSSGTAGAKMA